MTHPNVLFVPRLHQNQKPFWVRKDSVEGEYSNPLIKFYQLYVHLALIFEKVNQVGEKASFIVRVKMIDRDGVLQRAERAGLC